MCDNMNNQKGGDQWQTPEGLKTAIYKHFNNGNRMFDPCPVNQSFDGLESPWLASNFINPPYSRGQQIKWIKKAEKEAKYGKTSVLLLPSDTSTDHWHYAMKTANCIYLLDSRVRFVGASGSPKFGSAIVEYFNTRPANIFHSSHWNKKTDVLEVK